MVVSFFSSSALDWGSVKPSRRRGFGCRGPGRRPVSERNAKRASRAPDDRAVFLWPCLRHAAGVVCRLKKAGRLLRLAIRLEVVGAVLMRAGSDQGSEPSPDSGQAVELLSRIGSDQDAAASDLLPLVYEELRRLAGGYMRGERFDHTLQPTALVHEAYMRMIDA